LQQILNFFWRRSVQAGREQHDGFLPSDSGQPIEDFGEAG
jgi:hypothetical protein